MNGSAAPGVETASWRRPANLLTEIRIVAIPVLAWLVLHAHWGSALALLFAAGISDGLDGWVARHWRQQSALGEWLDPIADKGLLATLFVVLALAGRMPWALTILVFLRDTCIAGAAAVVWWRTGFRDFQPSWWGKAATTSGLATVTATAWNAALPSGWSGGLERFGWWVTAGLSVVSGIYYSLSCASRYHATRHAPTASYEI